MSNHLISVVLCTWNGEKFLEEQIDSILKQTYRPLEIIISDDASTDLTVTILRKFENDPMVRIFFQEKNLGLSANFNFASLKSKGDFIAYADQDDIWVPHHVQRLYEEIVDADLIYSNSELVDEQGNSLNKSTADVRNMYTGKDSRGYIFYSVVWGHGMLIRRSLLEESIPIPEGIHHDDWLAFRALTRGGIKYLDEILTKYRQHTGSSSKTIPQNVPRRKPEQRYGDFQKRKRWITLMMEHENDELKAFYSQLLSLFAKKEKGHFVWPLFFYLLRNRGPIFRFSKKSLASQLVEMIKQSRGERKQ